MRVQVSRVTERKADDRQCVRMDDLGQLKEEITYLKNILSSLTGKLSPSDSCSDDEIANSGRSTPGLLRLSLVQPGESRELYLSLKELYLNWGTTVPLI